jgi:outer membrane protein assembly factor BamD (BamD/ComL family)
MILRGESADAEITDALVAAFIRVGWQADARRAMDALMKQPAAQSDPYAAQAILRYGMAYPDREALAAAAERYRALADLHPDESKFRQALELCRKALEALTTRPTSTSASRPSE